MEHIPKVTAVAKTFFLLIVALLFQYCAFQKESITLYTIGDSTMADKKPETFPETGWCQVLENYFDETVCVENHARNGRSSKSFIEEGRWKAVTDSLISGDVVFIQFGHNDQKDYDSTRYTTPFGTYTENLERFVNETRQKGGSPVLITSIVRRKFDENGKLVDTHGDYPEATRQLAKRLDVPMIDLQKLTEEWVESLGDEGSKEMYLWVLPGENYPEGKKDDTHLSEEGAHAVAQMALGECISLDIAIADRIHLQPGIKK